MLERGGEYRGYLIELEVHERKSDIRPEWFCSVHLRKSVNDKVESRFSAEPGSPTPGQAKERAIWMAKATIDKLLDPANSPPASSHD